VQPVAFTLFPSFFSRLTNFFRETFAELNTGESMLAPHLKELARLLARRRLFFERLQSVVKEAVVDFIKADVAVVADALMEDEVAGDLMEDEVAGDLMEDGEVVDFQVGLTVAGEVRRHLI
jgi:hypothetical protein